MKGKTNCFKHDKRYKKVGIEQALTHLHQKEKQQVFLEKRKKIEEENSIEIEAEATNANNVLLIKALAKVEIKK